MQSSRISVVVVLITAMLATAAGAQTKRLDYKSVEALKDAKFYLAQVEGNLKLFDERSAGWKVGDPNVPLREVEGMLSTRPQIDGYVQNIENRFKVLTVDHPEVNKEREHFAAVKAQLDKTFGHLNALKSGLAGVVKQGEGEEYKADAKRLEEINAMFRNAGILWTNRPEAVGIASQMVHVKAERQRIAEKYADLLKQSTPPAEEMKKSLARVDSVFGAFEEKAKEATAALPSEIDGHVSEAIKGAQEAVAQKKPAWFSPTSDIASRIRQAQEGAELLKALSPDAATPYLAKVADARKQVATMSEALQGDVLEAARCPDERYDAPDKAELTEAVKAKWAAEGNGAEVLKAGMNSAGWRREDRWEWNGGAWRHVDQSKTQGFIVAKIDDSTAAVYHVNFTKDHLNGDKVSTYFFDDPKAPPTLHQKVLLKNVK